METDVLLSQFKEKVCDCIGLVCKMDSKDKMLAVNFWNQVSVRLQTVLDRTVKLAVTTSLSCAPTSKMAALPSPGQVSAGKSLKDCVIQLLKGDGQKLTDEGIALKLPSHKEVIIRQDDQNIDIVHNETETNKNQNFVLEAQQNNSKIIKTATMLNVSSDQLNNFTQVSPDGPLMSTEDDSVSFISSQVCTEEIVAILPEDKPDSCTDQIVVHTITTQPQYVQTELNVPDDQEVSFLNDESTMEPDNLGASQEIEHQLSSVQEHNDMDIEEAISQCSTLDALTKHRLNEKKPLVCEICWQRFATKGSLKVHSRRHTGNKPYKCDMCDQTFTTSGNLKRHKRTHTGEKLFECDVCHGKFAEKKNLKSHMVIHSGDKPFKCDACEKSFTQLSSLKSHQKIHKEIKSFVCDICAKSFVQKSNMLAHRVRHTNERNFGCDYCQNRFHTKADLVRHACSHLAGAVGAQVTLFPCRFCNKSFSRGYLLNNHIHKVHSNIKPSTHQTEQTKEAFV